MISVLICSFTASKYLQQTLLFLHNRDLYGKKYEILLDVEPERTGLQNTPKRYQELWKKSKGKFIVKSDDDMAYYQGWLGSCITILRDYPDIGYVSPMNHNMIPRKDMFVDCEIVPKEPLKPVYQNFISGGCWVFRRDLWEKVPYGNLNGIKTLDSNYGAAVRQYGLQPAYLNCVLASHIGYTRHSGEEVENAPT